MPDWGALFRPGPAETHSPAREQMLAGLVARGSQPARGWGDVVGNLAQLFVGMRGLRSQEGARERDRQAGQAKLAEALTGIGGQLGLDPGVDLGALAAHPLGGQMLGELMQRSRPQPVETPPAAPPDASQIAMNLGVPPEVMQQIMALPDHQTRTAALRHAVEANQGPEAPQGFTAGGIPFGPDGQPRIDPAQLRQYREAAGMGGQQRGPDYITPTNITMPDGSVRTVQTRSDLAAATEQGATLPQGASQQRQLTEGQWRARSQVAVMEPAIEVLTGASASGGGNLFESLASRSQKTLSGVPVIGNQIVGEDYQRAHSAIASLVSAYLFATSGQAVSEPELRRKTDELMPKPGDRPATMQDKWRKIEGFYRSVRQQGALDQAGDGSGPVGAPDLSQLSDDDILAALQRY